MRPLVEVAGEQLGQQGLGNVSHAAKDEADEDLHDGGPRQLHILLPLLAIGKGHQEQQQRQTGSQEAGHRFLQDTTVPVARLQQLRVQKHPILAPPTPYTGCFWVWRAAIMTPKGINLSCCFFLTRSDKSVFVVEEAILHVACVAWHCWPPAPQGGWIITSELTGG